MKKLSLLFWLVLSQLYLLNAQNSYKQNFLDLFKKLPEIKTCETGYAFFKCADNSCNSYKTAKATLSRALDELTNVQLALNTAVTSNVKAPSITAEDAEALAEKLEKMSDEEKQQWAMQNAHLYMNPVSTHVNQDANNIVVNDAVEYITERQREDMKDALIYVDVPAQFIKIEEKFQLQKRTILKTFNNASGIEDYDPSSGSPYIFGEATDAEVERFDKALLEFKKNIIPVYNAELNDKLVYLKSLADGLIKKYTVTEEKVASTRYADDAEENVNKTHIIIAHQAVLKEVIENFGYYEDVLLEYANKFASLQNIDPVDKFVVR